MPKPNFHSARPPARSHLPKLPPATESDQWLESFQQTDQSLYNLMAMEVWAIATTMDGILPGFWNRFMENRQVALKQVMHQKQSKEK
ncbi:MAG: hypothetical protein KME16_01675 [Scytolyngbya sp. HA4215-MV1]|jgi:hypothetical protein|nr:hypothetical protein [Scytolyngbya sp. HA4215-MV1]